MGKTQKQSILKVITFIFLVIMALVIIVPLGWMVISGFKTNGDLFTNSFGLPKEWKAENYSLAWKVGVGKYFLNSVLVTGVSTIITLLISAMAAFAITNHRLDFKGKNGVFIFILAGLMLAPQVSVIPLFKILTNLKLYNTYLAMIVPYVAFRIPFSVFLMRAYFLGLPASLDEAAYIDGLRNRFQEIVHVTIPSMKPQMLFGAVMSITSAFNMGWIGVTLAGVNPTPAYSGQLITNHIDDYGFIRYEMGYAACVSVMLLIIVYAFNLLAHRFFDEND